MLNRRAATQIGTLKPLRSTSLAACFLGNTNRSAPQVLVPYIRAKLDRLYEEESIRQRARQALPDDARDASWRAFYARAFVRAYPWCVAAHEGSRFAYQLLYLLGKTPYYLPGLHLLGLRVARTDPAAARARPRPGPAP